MELLDALSESFDHAAKIVGGVQAGQLEGPTPCTEWTLRQLLTHTTGVVSSMGLAARGLEPTNPNEYELDADPGTQFRTEAERTLAAWRARGLDGEMNVGAGPMPASVALGINLADTTTHSWDIAQASGQDTHIPDDVARAALGFVRQFVNDDVRAFAGFGTPVELAPTASPTDQLVAFLGRRPNPTP
jgi:uncharacterized protein (TIGR03086 family)